MINKVNATVEERLDTFRKDLDTALCEATATVIEKYTKKFFGDELPTVEFITLIHQASITSLKQAVRNSIIVSVFYQDNTIGVRTLDAGLKDYNVMVNSDEFKNKILESLASPHGTGSGANVYLLH